MVGAGKMLEEAVGWPLQSPVPGYYVVAGTFGILELSQNGQHTHEMVRGRGWNEGKRRLVFGESIVARGVCMHYNHTHLHRGGR